MLPATQLRDVHPHTKDAIKLTEYLLEVIVKPTFYSNECLQLVIDYIDTPHFSAEKESKEIILAYIKYLKECQNA